MLRNLFRLKPVSETHLMFFYAVRVGRKSGLYKSWKECEEQVKGYPQARFKKFKTRNEALDFIAPFKNIILLGFTSDIFISSQLGQDTKPTASKQHKTKVEACSTKIESSNIPVVYTDGGCFKNGRKGAKAGIGVFWGVGDARNVSERLSGNQTNQRAELNAAIRALETAVQSNMPAVELRTDSMYTINCATAWIKAWKRNGWKSSTNTEVKNQHDIQKLDELCNKLNVKWVHVRGHQGIFGNEQADRLSKEGAGMD